MPLLASNDGPGCRAVARAAPLPAGLLNIGQVVGYFGLLLMLDFPTFDLPVGLFADLLWAGRRARILELMNRENNLDQNASGYAGPMRGEIEFRDVTFRLRGRRTGPGECVLQS